jgi:hypothetical protein
MPGESARSVMQLWQSCGKRRFAAAAGKAVDQDAEENENQKCGGGNPDENLNRILNDK